MYQVCIRSTSCSVHQKFDWALVQAPLLLSLFSLMGTPVARLDGCCVAPQLRQLLQHTLAPQDRAGITEPLVDTVYSLSGGNPYW